MQTKYIEIQNYIEELIAKGENGYILPTEKELSVKFNVSHMTVRKVYEYFEKEGLLYRKKGKGTFIRKINFIKKDLHFFFLIPDYDNYQTNPIYTEIFNGIFKKLSIYNIKGHFSNFCEPFYSILKEIKKNECDAIISVTPEKIHFKFLEELSDRGYKVFAINRIIKNYNINYISADHIQDSYRLTKELIKRGIKKIGFIGLWEGHEFSKYRLKGYEKALNEEKIKLDTNLIVNLPLYFKKELITEKTINLIIRNDVESIICVGCSLLSYILKGIREIGLKIPIDIEVATFDKILDDIEEKKYIHEVIQPLEKIGEYAIESALKIIKGEIGKIEMVIPSKIIMKKKQNEE